MARGLSDDEISAIREQLAAGKRPRVQLSGPHFPVGSTGTVVRVGQPDTDGPDYLRVRVKVDNRTDELAFGPTELRVPGRPARKSAGRGPAGPAARKAPVKAAPAGETPATSQPVKSPPATTLPVKSMPAKATPAATPPAKAAPATSPPAKAARRRTGPAQKVTFTVASAGASWALTATRGSKNVAKNVPLPPGVVSALAELLGQPGLSEAVGEINDAALAEAQARADQLRAELSQLEAVLATHSRP